MKIKGKIEEREAVKIKRIRGTNETYRGIILEVGVKSVGEDQDKSFTCAFILCRVFTRLRDLCINDTLTKVRGKPRDNESKFFLKSHALTNKTCNAATFSYFLFSSIDRFVREVCTIKIPISLVQIHLPEFTQSKATLLIRCFYR